MWNKKLSNPIALTIMVFMAIVVVFAINWYSNVLIAKNSNISRIEVAEKIEIKIKDFNDCLLRGYPIMESYPRQCRAGEGRVFIEDIGNQLEKEDLIIVDSPRPNELAISPLEIKGQAVGYWFFEGDFPIKLLDDDGNVIAEGVATALSDWMVEEFVNFEAEIEFETPSSYNGDLILEKDNPSGLPENVDFLRIPVIFYK